MVFTIPNSTVSDFKYLIPYYENSEITEASGSELSLYESTGLLKFLTSLEKDITEKPGKYPPLSESDWE